MIINLIKKDFFKSDYRVVTSYKHLRSNVGVDGDNLSRSRSTFEDYDFTENGRKYKSADFDIQSLLSVGAFDMLQPTYVSSLSSMSFADKFQGVELPKPE